MISPWLTICRMAPYKPCCWKMKMPSVTKPMWLTDEYATSFLRSGCTRATIAP